MARGKKYSEDIKEKAYFMYASSGSYEEVGRMLGVASSTVRSWIKAHANAAPDEFETLRAEKKRDFVERSTEIIDIALDRLKKELINAEEIPVNQLSTVIGTLYDKRALAKGESTDNTRVTFTLPKELDDYAD